MKFLGIEIERKTDILAATAFLLSVIGITYQTAAFIRGSDVRFFAPEQLIIAAQQFPDGKSYVRFIVPMSYVNRGATGNNAIVGREILKFDLDRPYEQTWHRFVETDFDSQGRLVIKEDNAKSAAPFVVTAGGAEYHETFFLPVAADCDSPCTWANYLSWEGFLLALENRTEVQMTFSADIVGGYKREKVCSFQVSTNMVAYLKNNKWAPVACRQRSL